MQNIVSIVNLIIALSLISLQRMYRYFKRWPIFRVCNARISAFDGVTLRSNEINNYCAKLRGDITISLSSARQQSACSWRNKLVYEICLINVSMISNYKCVEHIIKIVCALALANTQCLYLSSICMA